MVTTCAAAFCLTIMTSGGAQEVYPFSSHAECMDVVHQNLDLSEGKIRPVKGIDWMVCTMNGEKLPSEIAH